jgi:hypothetical protein
MDAYVQQTYSGLGMTNYKMMKCFYFERDKYCKYGNACMFAHSDRELKTPNDINYLSSIATALNNQLRGGSEMGSSGDQNMINNQYAYANYANYDNLNTNNQMMMSNQVNGQAYYNYQYQNYAPNYSNYQTGQYDSYTPDTNYGDTTQTQTQSNVNPPYAYDPNYQYANYGNYAGQVQGNSAYDYTNAYQQFQYSNVNQTGVPPQTQSNIIKETVPNITTDEQSKATKKITIELNNK